MVRVLQLEDTLSPATLALRLLPLATVRGAAPAVVAMISVRYQNVCVLRLLFVMSISLGQYVEVYVCHILYLSEIDHISRTQQGQIQPKIIHSYPVETLYGC